MAHSASAEVRALERHGEEEKPGMAPHPGRGAGDLRHPFRGRGERGHPGDDRVENEAAGKGDRLLRGERLQDDGGLSSECQRRSVYRPLQPPPGKDDQPGRTPFPDGQHADQCREMEHRRRTQCHQSQARLLLQRIRCLIMQKPRRAGQVSS